VSHASISIRVVEVTCNSYRPGVTTRAYDLIRRVFLDGTPIANRFGSFRHELPMPSDTQRSVDRASSVDRAASSRNADEARAWPRYEPAFTHFELGDSPDYRRTPLMARRFTPRQGAGKD
jgi:hypothetical protein